MKKIVPILAAVGFGAVGAYLLALASKKFGPFPGLGA